MGKLTGKVELAETPANDDLIHVVDVSDTTDDAAGTSKKVQRSNLVGGLQPILTEGAFVDGDKTKLDGIETGADVTDATNVTAAGALMDSEVTNLAAVKAFDPTDYATAAQGATADSALQPSDLASGTITPRVGAVDLSGGSDGNVLTVQADGSLAVEALPAAGAIAIDDVSDITITTPADNEVLAYNNGTSEWINQTPAEAGLQAVLSEGAFVDGDKTKLDGIETGADVTDATNVDAAGATMNTDTDVSTNSWVLDEDTMTSNSATKVPTQQSVKAYVDANAGGSSNPYGADIVVATSGGDYTDLQAAMDAAPANSIIFVEAGTHEWGNSASMNSGLTIIGASAYSTIIAQSDAISDPISSNGATFKNIQFRNNASGQWSFTGTEMTFESCKFYNGSASSFNFRFQGTGMKFVNTEFSGNAGNGRVFEFDPTSELGCTVTGCRFYVDGSSDTTYGIIDLDNGVTFTGNHITVYTEPTTNGVIIRSNHYKNVITGNVIVGVSGKTVGINASGGGVISGNTFTEFAKGVNVTGSGTRGSITGNTFYTTSGGVGVDVGSGGSHALISGNQFYAGAAGADAIYVDADDVVVMGNSVNGTWTDGVHTTVNADRTIIMGNNLYDPTNAVNDNGTATQYQTATNSDPLNVE